MPAEKNLRILVIDDNRAIHDDFRKILAPLPAATEALDASDAALFGPSTEVARQTHFEIDSAYQGQEGLLLVKKALEEGRPYAMAFVDVRMPPGWDGVETTRKIWELDPNLQVVLCTAYADYSWDEMFEKLGHSDALLILKKPFDAVEASQLAHALTEKWELHHESRRKMEDLESLVVARTQELQQTNQALQAEVVEHKRAEESLRLLGSAVESVRESILITDAQLEFPGPRIMFVNPAFTKMTGYTAEEAFGKTPRNFQGPRTDKSVLSRLRQNLERGEVFAGEAINYRKDGTEFNLEWQVAPIRADGGKITHFVSVQRDITERKRAAEELRESERRFSDMLRNLELASVMLDREGRITYCNDYLLRVTGWQREEVMGGDWLKLFLPPEVVGELQDVHALLLQNQPSAWHFENEILTRSGARRFIRWNNSVLRSAGGEVIGTTSIGEDITERRQAEAAFRDSNEKFHQLADNITDAFWIRSADMREVHYVSPAFERIWGRTVESLYANPHQWADFILPEDRQRVLDAFAALTGNAASLEIEYRIVRPDGEIRSISVRSFQVRDASARLIRHIGIVTDITERKRFQAQLVQSQKMETVGKLAGGVAHEFNSIMTAIIGQSELMLGALPPGNPLSRNAREIRMAAERAATLTRQLLAYGRKQILQPEVLDLNSVLAGMESTLSHLMGRGTEVSFARAAGLKAVQADAGQLEQVIMNLAMNAADAMPNSGKLTIETANVTLGQEEISRFPELKAGDYVMLAITDTGAGMSEEVKSHLFEPFFSTKSVGQGTGLGLSTCYGIIKQSGGHISIYSEPGCGAAFKIYLPQVDAQATVPIQRLTSPDLPRGTETILLVEDDPALREMAAALLRRLGYTVLPAANGVEALSLKQQRGIGHIDALFTDVVMPHMSGKELSERVKAIYPQTRVLFTSAYTENAIVHQGVLDKGVAFLPKPFTPSALARRLREVLDQPVPPGASPALEELEFAKISIEAKD